MTDKEFDAKKNQSFYGTFGQKYSTLRDHYVVIRATVIESAWGIMNRAFGGDWSWLYTEDDWSSEHFPGGLISLIEAQRRHSQEQEDRLNV